MTIENAKSNHKTLELFTLSFSILMFTFSILFYPGFPLSR